MSFMFICSLQVSIIVIFFCGVCHLDDTLPRLGINKKYFDDVEVVEEKREGVDIVLNCEYYKSPSEVGRPTMAWYHNGNKITEKGTDKRVYVLELSRNDHICLIKLTLKNLLSDTDDGEYECRMTSSDERTSMSRKLKLVVIKAARWRNNDKVVAASIDQPLVIDCEADSDPKPDISIQLANSNANMPDRYQVEDNKIRINSLTLADRGTEIQCTASQVLDNHDENPVVVKYVTIDVHYSPQFEGGEQTTRYGIFGKNVSIPCRVTDSNPNVKSFQFYEETVDVDGSKLTSYISTHPVTVNLVTQSAYLNISSAQDEHFKKIYECVADNGKHRSSQKIIFEKTYQPNIPRVAQLGTDDEYTVKWSIEDDKPPTSGLPILKYRIKYLEESKLGTDSNNASNLMWASAKEVEFLKDNSNIYKIDGLRKNTRYGFRFQSVNEAGDSDWSQSYTTLVQKQPTNSCSKNQVISRTFLTDVILPQLIILLLRQFAGR